MRKFTLAAMAIMVATPAVLPAPAFAQERYRDYNNRQYRGQDRSYYEHCKKSSGTTGAVAGGGTLAGAGGGALLGRHLDKKHDAAQNRKNGC
jgi:hypothetical protein